MRRRAGRGAIGDGDDEGDDGQGIGEYIQLMSLIHS